MQRFNNIICIFGNLLKIRTAIFFVIHKDDRIPGVFGNLAF